MNTPNVYMIIGAAVCAMIAWLGGVVLPKLITRTIDSRFERRDREERDYRMEQIEDAIRQQRGQQVTTDCLHEILRHMITGNHIEDLERVQRELEAFREENGQALLKKAAKYNMR